MVKYFDAVIVGGGASGMMCACVAKEKKIAVIDAGTKPAKKIMVTGNGRCNLTNKNVSSRFYNQNIDKFLKRFDQNATLDFFKKLGLETISDDEGRVYPLSNSAKSVVDVLNFGATGAEYFLGEKVNKIEKTADGFDVCVGKDILKTQKLVIATGGGSEEVLKMLNVRYKKFVPSLVSLQSDATRDLNGTRVSGVLVKAKDKNGHLAEETGEVLFRENGLSGIVVFDLSTLFSRQNDFSGEVSIDLLPNISLETLESVLDKRKALDVRVDKFFVGMFANSVANEIFKQAGIDTNKPCKALTLAEISLLAKTTKNLKFEVNGHLGNNQVFSGGVSLEDLDENLMHKQIENLFFVGEVCDVDGVCGGFNLQWAWTSGHIVGENL